MTETTTTLGTLREIRLVGRGGQGIVTAGELIGEAALLDGRFA
jgi:Pyruvate/2-oxoacid:ferredoxin oxidoreductase gamma subunit